MGLKTASFSQCRRLTVASTKVGATSCLRWDLTELAANPESDWLLFEGPAPGSEPSLARLDGKASGTLVLWEDLDRIVSAGSTADDFLDVVDAVETHLAMVFHRLIQGPQPRLRLLLNGRLVRAWDPFMTGHPAKPWSSPLPGTWRPMVRWKSSATCCPTRTSSATKTSWAAQAPGLDGAARVLRLPQ